MLNLVAVTACLALSAMAMGQPLNSRSGTCRPLKLVPRYKNMEDHCDKIRDIDEVPESELVEFFAAAPPVTPDRKFPLKGCVAGCVTGENWELVVHPPPSTNHSFGNMCFLNVLDGEGPVQTLAMVHKKGQQPTAHDIVVEDSWSQPVREKNRGAGVWAITYDQETSPKSWKKGDEQYRVIREEMKQHAAGAVLVKAYTETISSKTSDTEFTEFHYGLFQVCDDDGLYLLNPIGAFPSSSV